MKNRGQVTLFVILGVLAILIVIILIVISRFRIESIENTSEIIDISQTKQEVDNLVQSCLRDVTERAVWTAAEHGGYALQTNALYYCPLGFDIFNEFIYYDNIEREHLDDYTYFGISGKGGLQPLRLERVEADSIFCLKDFIQKKMLSCINEFTPLLNKGWNKKVIGAEKVEVERVELGESVVVEVNIPILFTRDQNGFQIDHYSYTVDFSFFRAFAAVKKAVDECESGGTRESIEEAIQNIVGDEYYVLGYTRGKSPVIFGEHSYQYIIKKGDIRFKFGLSCQN